MSGSLSCPRCRQHLEQERRADASFFRCGTCRGLMVTVALLRRFVPQDRLRRVWSRLADGTPSVPCPSCTRPMRTFPYPDGARPIELDGCQTCQVLWFDGDELIALSPERQAPDTPLEPHQRRTPEEAEALVKIDVAGSRFSAGEVGALSLTVLESLLDTLLP